MSEAKIDYPEHTTFKAVFRPQDDTRDHIASILVKYNLEHISINHKESRTGKFISYTITALFPSKDTLNQTCSDISNIQGCMYLF